MAVNINPPCHYATATYELLPSPFFIGFVACDNALQVKLNSTLSQQQ